MVRFYAVGNQFCDPTPVVVTGNQRVDGSDADDEGGRPLGAVHPLRSGMAKNGARCLTFAYDTLPCIYPPTRKTSFVTRRRIVGSWWRMRGVSCRWCALRTFWGLKDKRTSVYRQILGRHYHSLLGVGVRRGLCVQLRTECCLLGVAHHCKTWAQLYRAQFPTNYG